MDISEQTNRLPAEPVGIVMRETLGDILDTMEAVDQVAGSVAASRARLIDSARQLSEAMARNAEGAHVLGNEPHRWNAGTRHTRELAADIAIRLRVPEGTAQRLIAEAKQLIHRLPTTEVDLAAGEFSYRHAQVIIEETYGLGDPMTGDLEALLLPAANELTVSQFKEFARKLREKLNPGGMNERHRDAASRRTVTLDFERDGMALLSAYLPAEVAMAAHDRLTRLALAVGRVMVTADDTEESGDGGKRTLSQLRADVFGDLMINGDTCDAGDPSMHGIRPQLLVSVPALTMLRAEDAPGHLSGYGPIAPETARELAARAPSFARVLTDPINGVILDFDDKKYVVRSDLRTVLTLQFERCSFPGCRRPASQCEMDHTVDWAKGGTTSLSNLAPLCKKHHNLKHHSAMKVTKRADGAMQWFTATGRMVVSRPDNLLGEGMLARGSPTGGDPPSGAPPGGAPPGQLFGSEWDNNPDRETFPF